MLSDEEKKAIEVLEYVKDKTPFIFWYEEKPFNRKETIDTILNLIKKQSKEIDELKEENEKYKNPPFFDEENYISKEELKEILGLEEGDDDSIEGILDYIETIVSECNRLEDIEEKVQIEYNNIFNKGVKSVEDKIKAKIEELKAIADNGANAVRFAMTHEDEIERIQKQKDIGTMVETLQSLLEKEQ